MKLKKLAIVAPLTLALAISQNLQAAPALDNIAVGEKPQISAAAKKRYDSPMYKIKRNEHGERLLDMTDKEHYKFAKSRLKKANMSEADYPQLHKSLDDLKQQQILAKESGESPTVTKSSNSTLIENSHMFLNMQIAVSDADGKAYLMIRAESSVYGGTNSTYIDLLLENENYGQLAPMGSTFAVLEGKKTHAVSSISLEALKASNPNLDKIYASSWIDTEDENGVITSGLRFVEYPWDWTDVEAEYGAYMGSAATASVNKGVTKASTRPVYQANHPKDGANAANPTPDGYVKVCLNRSHSDCDYTADQLGQTNSNTYLYIPFQGQITVPQKVTSIFSSDVLPTGLDEATNIYVQEKNNGGVTPQAYQSLNNGVRKFSDYLSAPMVDTVNEQTIITWDIPREEGEFGNALLFSNHDEVNWRLSFAVRGTPTFGRGREGNFLIQVNSDNIEHMSNYYSQSLDKMRFGYSCLAKGTMITMADGTEKAIEEILNGEMVMGAMAKNSSAMQPMKVVDTSIGIENIEMYRIHTEDGQSILMTETHPISTANKGIVWGKELKKGDRVLTADGSVLVTKIKKEKYKDNIYNLKLEPVAGSLIAEGEYLGMYANGMLVGDLETQDEHNYKDQGLIETPEEKLQRMPEKWKVDYISSLNKSAK